MSLSQPSRVIVVEPIQAPTTAPAEAEPSRRVAASAAAPSQ
jgi:hypothetical protein